MYSTWFQAFAGSPARRSRLQWQHSYPRRPANWEAVFGRRMSGEVWGRLPYCLSCLPTVSTGLFL